MQTKEILEEISNAFTHPSNKNNVDLKRLREFA